MNYIHYRESLIHQCDCLKKYALTVTTASGLERINHELKRLETEINELNLFTMSELLEEAVFSYDTKYSIMNSNEIEE